MAIVQIISPREITWDTYNKVQERIDQDGQPEGMIIHLAVDNGGKPRFINVWESEEHAQRFGERIAPLLEEFQPDAAGPPDPDQMELMEVKTLRTS
jgi:hypothetical protein